MAKIQFDAPQVQEQNKRSEPVLCTGLPYFYQCILNGDTYRQQNAVLDGINDALTSHMSKIELAKYIGYRISFPYIPEDLTAFVYLCEVHDSRLTTPCVCVYKRHLYQNIGDFLKDIAKDLGVECNVVSGGQMPEWLQATTMANEDFLEMIKSSEDPKDAMWRYRLIARSVLGSWAFEEATKLKQGERS